MVRARHKARSRPFGILCTLLWLASCAPAPERPEVSDDAAWAERRLRFAALRDWRIDGRVAVDAGEEGWSGALSWRQHRDALELNVRGPLGTGGFRASAAAGRMQVVTSDGETLELADPERELAERYGWSVPVEQMRYWLLGIPAPSPSARTQVDAHGRAERLDQNGWQVTYRRYVEFDGWVLPRRLEMTRGEVRVRVVIDRWRADAA